MVSNFIHICSLVVSSCIAKAYKFDITLRSHEDWDFLVAMLHGGCRFTYIPMIGGVAHWDHNHSHRGQGSRNQGEWPLDFLQIYRRWPAQTADQRERRRQMLSGFGLEVPSCRL